MIAILRSIAAQVGSRVQESIGQFVDVDRLRGLHLGIDTYWMEWLRTRLYIDDFRESEWFYPSVSKEDFFKYMPPEWDRHCSQMGYQKNASPVQFRFIFRDPSDLKKITELPKYYENYPIVYESRPACVGLSALSLSPNDSVGQNSPFTAGTIGGLFRDTNNGMEYILSCAHVLGDNKKTVFTPGPADSKNGTAIADVRMSVLPQPNKSQSCNNRTHGVPDSLDIALAEVKMGTSVNFIIPGFHSPKHVTSFNQMKTGDQITFFGKTSGKVDAVLGSLCIYHEIEIDKQPRCFGDIFTITYPTPWYINANLAKPGDSGSCILRSINHLTTWEGMLFACDGATGYACFAENIMNQIQSLSSTIGLVP